MIKYSNYPTDVIFKLWDNIQPVEGSLAPFQYSELQEIYKELESRVPNEASHYFGDCAGKPVFIPIEPEYDHNGNPIFENMIGYDGDGNEVWI